MPFSPQTDRTCMNGSYADVSAGVCIDCFTACVSGCSGSLPISGQGGCDRCHVMLVYPNGTQVRGYTVHSIIIESLVFFMHGNVIIWHIQN